MREPISKRATALLASLPLALSACASQDKAASDSLDNELEELIAMLPGHYSGEAPNAMQPDGEMQTLVHTFAPANAPQLGERLFYYHITRESIDGPILQAKIFSFDTDENRKDNTMRAFVLRPELAETLRDGDTQAWSQLDSATLMSFPETCYFTWEREEDGFKAEDADTCSYPSVAFKQTITPDMIYRISPTQFEMEETLLGEDGTAIVSTGGALIAMRISQRNSI